MKNKNTPTIVYLSLGANVGDRVGNIKSAIKELASVENIKIERKSSFYLTEPVGLKEQPEFVNCTVKIKTTLPPGRLLKVIKSIERKLGRKKTIRYGPRTIDIDILFYGEKVISTKKLTIPHRELTNRKFVIIPLREIIEKDFRHPVCNLTIEEIFKRQNYNIGFKKQKVKKLYHKL